MRKNLLRMRARRKGVVLPHAGKAFLATAMASFTCAVPAKLISPDCSPVAGLNTGDMRPDVPSTNLPLM